MNLAYSIIKNYDIYSLKILYEILSRIQESETSQLQIPIKDLAKAVGYTKQGQHLKKLGEKTEACFDRNIKALSKEIDANGLKEWETISFFKRAKYKNGTFYIDANKDIVAELDNFLFLKKKSQLFKMTNNIGFRIYQLLYSHISKGEYILYLDKFQDSMNLNMPNSKILDRLREVFTQFKETEEIDISIKEIKQLKKEEKTKKKVYALKILFERKKIEKKEISYSIEMLNKLEMICSNRYFNEKYKSNIARNNLVIHDLIEKHGKLVVYKALEGIRKELNVEIKATLQAYVTKCILNELENQKALEEAHFEAKKKEAEKVEEKKAEEKKKEEKTQEIKDSYAEFEQLSDTEKEVIEEKAKEIFMKDSGVENWSPILNTPYKFSRTSCIIKAMKESA